MLDHNKSHSMKNSPKQNELGSNGNVFTEKSSKTLI